MNLDSTLLCLGRAYWDTPTPARAAAIGWVWIQKGEYQAGIEWLKRAWELL